MQMPVWLVALGSVCSGLCLLTFAAPLLILGYFLLRRVERAYQSLINQWASENGWEIIHQEGRLVRHPWLIDRIANQKVYFLSVKYRDGRPFYRHAWIRCGGWYWRPENAKIELRWEEGLPQPLPPPFPETSTHRDDPLWDPWVDSL